MFFFFWHIRVFWGWVEMNKKKSFFYKILCFPTRWKAWQVCVSSKCPSAVVMLRLWPSQMKGWCTLGVMETSASWGVAAVRVVVPPIPLRGSQGLGCVRLSVEPSSHWHSPNLDKSGPGKCPQLAIKSCYPKWCLLLTCWLFFQKT